MSKKKKNETIEKNGVYITNEKGFDNSFDLKIEYNEITKEEEKELKIKFYDLISFCSYTIVNKNDELVEFTDDKFQFKVDMDLTYSKYKVAKITYDEDGNKIVTEIPSEYKDKQIIFEDDEIGEYAFYGKKKKLLALPIMAAIIALIAIFGITYATIPGFRDMINETFTDILDLDEPTAPEIKAEKDDWALSNLVSITKDAKVGGTGKLQYYEYCVRDDQDYKKCKWESTFTKNTIVAHDGIHYVWFRGVSNSGKTGKISNMEKVLIDTTAPIIKNVDFKDVTKDSIEIELDSEDNLSGINKIIYQIDDGELVESKEFSHKFNNLLPNTEHKITIYVFDKVGNESKTTILMKTLEGDTNIVENENIEESEYDKELKLPTYSVSPANSTWSMYKYVTITYPKNAKIREYSIDGGKTWLPYNGPVLFTKNGTIIARCSNNNYAVVADPFDVVFIDPVVPIVSLDNIPSVFEYGSNYKLPGYVKFGESGGSVTCTVDGIKQVNTSTLGIGKHIIECTATSKAGAVTVVTKEIEVDYMTGMESVDGAWANLTLKYPEFSTNRKWMVYDPNTVVQYDSYYYQWSDYVGPIKIRVEDIEKVLIQYDMEGITTTSSYSGKPFVVIQPNSYRIARGDTTKVTLAYGPTNYQSLQYRLGEDGAWIDYKGTFEVGPNTIIEARIVTTYDVKENNNKVVSKKLTDYHTAYISEIGGSGGGGGGGNDGLYDLTLIINCPSSLNENEIGRCTITFGSSYESKEYKIYKPTSSNNSPYVSYTNNSSFEVEAGDVVYARGQYLDSDNKIRTVPRIFRIEDNTGGKISIIPANSALLENEKTDVKIVYDASLENNKYRVNGGAWTTYVDPFEVEAGSFVEAIGQIPGSKKPVYKSKTIGKDGYSLSISASNDNPKYGSTSIITINYSKYMNLKKYRINGGDWQDYTGPFNVGPDSTVEAWGKAGDLYDLYETKVIGHTDYIPPYIIPGPTISFANVAESKYLTEFSITTSRPARVIKYTIGLYNTNYTDYEYPTTISKGKWVCAYYQDEETGYNSNRTCDHVEWPNSDPGDFGLPPHVGYSLSPSGPLGGTKKVEKVTVSLSPGGASILQYSYDNVVWLDYTGPFDVFTNCTIYVYGRNSYGSDSKVIHINYIGDVAPNPQGGLEPIRINANPSGKIVEKDENGDPVLDENGKQKLVTPTSTKITITWDSQATEKYYRIGTGDLWKPYTEPFEVTKNCTIYAYQVSPDGTSSASKIIGFFDDGYAEPIIDYSPKGFITTAVTVNIEYDPNAIRNTYSTDGFTFDDYIEPFEVTENNTTIYAKSEFADGTIKYSTAIVGGNIAHPKGRIESNSDAYYIIYLNYPESSLESSRMYKYKKTGVLTKYKEEGIMLIKEDKVSEVLDADGTAYIIDANGKKEIYHGDHYLLDVDINNVWEHVFMTWENASLEKPQFVVDEENEWVGEVNVAILYPKEANTRTYTIVDQNGNKQSGTYQGVPLKITKNCTITATAKSKVGVESEAVYVVKNVDGGDPSVRYMKVTNATMDSITLEFSAVDAGVGIGGYSYSLDGTNWIPSDSPVHVFDNLDKNTTYTLYALAYDTLGHATQVYSIKATTKNIDKPTFSVSPDATQWSTQKTITITYLSDDYTNEYSVDNGVTWVKYTGPITVNKPTVIIARSSDGTNTSYSYTLNLTRIDDTKPITNSISTTSLSSRITVKANATDNDSGILRYYYSLDGTNYYSSFNNTYTFNNLDKDTTYDIYVYSENMSGLLSDVINTTEKTLDIDPPFFTQINSYDDKENLLNVNSDTQNDVIDNVWSYKKTVTIKYPYLDEDCIYEYALVDLNNPQNLVWKNAIVDKATGLSNAKIEIAAENMAIIARVVSGPNVVAANTLKLDKIDRTEPTIDLNNVPKSLQIGDSYKLPSNFAGDNNKSGATAQCKVNDNIVENTDELRSGMHPLECTVTTGAGHSVTIKHTLPIYPSLTFNVDSILQGVQTANITTDGDFYFSVNTGSETVKYNTEMWLYNGNTVFADPEEKFCDDVEDKMCIIKVDGDLTITSDVIVTPQVPKKGFLVYVTGKLTNNGEISMTNLGYPGVSENVYLYKNTADVYEVVPKLGGIGAESAVANNTYKTVNGNVGIQTSRRATGGGGSGGAVMNANYVATSGAGGNGTSYSGGSGGGAAVGTCNVIATPGSELAGPGGIGAKCGSMNYGIGGGVGHPTAISATSANTRLESNSGAGGLLIIYANDFENNNTISSNGLDALSISGTNAGNSLYAAGGGSGAGSINIFYNNLSSKGTVEAIGGKGGTATNATRVADGGNGADGSITFNTFTNNQVLGSRENPYKITNTQEFLNLKNIVNDYDSAYIELLSDINLSGYNFEPIGTASNPFAANFDGNNHTINGLNIEETSDDNIGLFGLVSNGVIKNLKITNANVTGNNNVGILAGLVSGDSTIENIIVDGEVTGNENVGGLIGQTASNNEQLILSSVSVSKINGVTITATGNNVGGLIGKLYTINNADTVLENASTKATITSTASNVGGLVGLFENKSTEEVKIEKVSSEGTITGIDYVGGLVGKAISNNEEKIAISKAVSSVDVTGNDYVAGFVAYMSKGNIDNAYSTGNVTSNDYAGSFIGYVENSNILNTYAIGAVNSTLVTNIGGYAGVSENTTAENSYFSSQTTKVVKTALGINTRIKYMLSASKCYNDFDFADIWSIDENVSTAYLQGLYVPNNIYSINRNDLSGLGTASNPYLIYNADDLIEINNELGAYYVLMNDINLTGIDFDPIGQEKFVFTGTLIGNGHKITGLNVDVDSLKVKDNVGLFETLDGAIISDLTIEDANVSGENNVGILAGKITKSTVLTNIKVKGKVVGKENVGGVSGYLEISESDYISSVNSVDSDVEIEATKDKVGGIFGNINIKSTMNNQLALYKLNAKAIINNTDNLSNYVGGVVGYVENNSNEIVGFTDVKVEGEVKGVNYTGGAFGKVENKSTGTIYINKLASSTTVEGKTNYTGGAIGWLYNTVANGTIQLDDVKASGDVTSTKDYVGGLIGYSQNVSTGTINIENFAATGDVKGVNQVGGAFGYILAQNRGTTNISKGYAKGNVTATGTEVGGFVGRSSSNSNTIVNNISKCYSEGNVTGTTRIGGFVGFTTYSKLENTFATGSVTATNIVGSYVGEAAVVTINNSYAIGKITTTGASVGGFAATASSTTATNCYFSSQTSGYLKTAVGVNLDTKNQKIDKLLKQSSYSGYDFTDDWDIQDNVTTAYLRALPIPDSVKAVNITFNHMDGDGTQSNPYVIKTPDDVNDIRNEASAYYILANDIDMTNYSMIPIGESAAPFSGTIDGQGYTISGYSYTSNLDNVGLFSLVTNATIKNLTIDNFNISGRHYVGSLAGNVSQGLTLDNVNITNTTVTGTGSYVGGAVGYVNESIVQNNLFNKVNVDVTVTGAERIGGIIGYSYQSIADANITFNECTTAGTITGNNYVGGAVGYLLNPKASNVTLTSNETNATINGSNSASESFGGLVGKLENQNVGTITIDKNTNNGNITNLRGSTSTITTKTGGLVGYLLNSNNGQVIITTNKNFGEITGKDSVGGIVGYYHSLSQNNKVSDIENKNTITGRNNVAGAVGYFETNSASANIEFSHILNEGDIIATENIGGAVGQILNRNTATIKLEELTSQTGKIQGTTSIGGILGLLNNASAGTIDIDKMYSSVEIEATGNYVGGIIGQIYAGSSTANQTISIDESYATKDIKGVNYVGGLIGSIRANSKNHATITKAYALGNITGKNYIGGLIGQSLYTDISIAYATGNLEAVSYVGGLIGQMTYNNIENTYATGTYENAEKTSTTKATDIGGLVGTGDNSYIKKSYASGKIYANGNMSKGDPLTSYKSYNTTIAAGSLIGVSVSNVIEDTYYSSEMSGLFRGVNGISRTLDAMLHASNYNFDFTTIWSIDEGTSTPYLQGFVRPDQVDSSNFATMRKLNGSGTDTDPYLVYNLEDLNYIRFDKYAVYKLMNDIDLTINADGAEFLTIGEEKEPFMGVLDGNNHKIYNGAIASLDNSVGLFSSLKDATIKDLTLENIKYQDGMYVGQIAGIVNENVIINNVDITNVNELKGVYVGGVVGYISQIGAGQTTINNINLSTNIKAHESTTEDVSGEIGGIVGHIYNNGVNNIDISNITISNQTNLSIDDAPYYNKTTDAQKNIGGIVGKIVSEADNNITISDIEMNGTINCIISTDKMTQNRKYLHSIGGIVGRNISDSSMNLTIKDVQVKGAIGFNDIKTNKVLRADITVGGAIGYNEETANTSTNQANVTLQNVTVDTSFNNYFTLENDYIENKTTKYYGINFNTQFGGLIGRSDFNSPKDNSLNNKNNLTITSCVVNSDIYNLADGNNDNSYSNVQFTGGLVGYIDSSTIGQIIIEKSYTTGSYSSSTAGGIVGSIWQKVPGTVKLELVYSQGDVTGATTGGLVGAAHGTLFNTFEINKSYSIGTISGGTDVGGIAGLTEYVEINDVFTTGEVKGSSTTTNAASFVGKTVNTKINHSYGVGEVSSLNTIGGFVSKAENSVSNNSYFSSSSTKLYRTALGTNLRIDKMLKIDPCYEEWDFDDTWAIDVGTSLAYLKQLPRPDSVNASNYNIKPTNGQGTQANAYEIYNVDDFSDMRIEPYAYYKLMNDLDFDGVQYVPIGEDNQIFTGHLDGQGFKISNIDIKDTGFYNGLFGVVEDATIKNLTIENIKVSSSKNDTGALIGLSKGNTYIEDINITYSDINSTGSNVGGLIGTLDDNNIGQTTIKNVTIDSIDDAIITGTNNIGGLIGYLNNETSEEIYITNVNINNVDINSSIKNNLNIGGLIGYAKNNSESNSLIIKNRINISGNIETSEGTISEKDNYSSLGGLIGNLENSYGTTEIANVTSNMVINNSAEITGSNKTIYIRDGGLIGYINITGNGNLTIDGVKTLADVTTSPTLTDEKLTSLNTYTGGILGMLEVNNSGTIELKNSYNTGKVTGVAYVGGLIGHYYNKSTGTMMLSKSYNTGEVSGEYDYVGGIAGYFNSRKNVNDVIEKTYNSGAVKTKGEYIGGFVGQLVYTNVNDCYSTGDVTGKNRVSAFIGASDFSNVTNVYTTGKITSSGNIIGSILSQTSNDVYTNAYFSSETTGYSRTQAGLNVRYEKLLHQMNYSNYDFTDVWSINEGNDTAYLQGLASHASKPISYAKLTGTGTLSDPYLIHDYIELRSIAGDLDAYYELASDIIMPTGEFMYPIGTEENPFTGSFNGNGYTIENINIKHYMEDAGLFGYVENAIIMNVNIKNANVESTTDYVGILAGRVMGASTIEQISIQGNVETTGEYAGAVAGYVQTYDGKRLNISNIKLESPTIVRGLQYSGGLIGQANNILNGTLTIRNIEGDVDVKSQYAHNVGTGYEYVVRDYAGGLIAQLNATGVGPTIIENVSLKGIIIGKNYAGGLIAQANGNLSRPIEINKVHTNCELLENVTYVGGIIGDANYINMTDIGANGIIEGNYYTGGLVGYLSNSSITSAYANVLPKDFRQNFDHLVGESTSNIYNNLYYVKMVDSTSLHGTELDGTNCVKQASYIGFDFVETWKIIENVTTPYLDIDFKSNSYHIETTIESDSILEAVETITTSSIYKIKVNDEEYKAHVYVYNGDQEWNEDKSFGSDGDVSTSTSDEAQRMVIVKVDGNLTIGEKAKVEPYYTDFGGPKGFMLYVTGTFTNNGIIDNSHGAYAEGDYVYLWKNINSDYVYIDKDGANGREAFYATYNTSGRAGYDGQTSLRQTGGGGTGSVSSYNSVATGPGAKGTSYSGGSGGGGAYRGNGASGKPNGGAGGYGGTNSGGGAGNPGGNRGSSGNGYTSTNGENKTGGLLIIYADKFNNTSTGSLTAIGGKGGSGYYPGGGSGGGSINIFVKNLNEVNTLLLEEAEVLSEEQLGNVDVRGGYGGSGSYSGGAGGKGTVNIGRIKDGQYYDLKDAYENEINDYINSSPIEGTSIISLIADDRINKTDYYNLKINDNNYLAHVYVYDGDQVWNDQIEPFGDEKDVANKRSENTSTEVGHAKRMVIVKVNGNLTIGHGVTIGPYFDEEYGGPKGFMLYVTGTLTNNGTIDNSHGAIAKNEDVYLFKNADGTYEYISKDIIATGGAGILRPCCNALSAGNPGKDGTSRSTGGGGSGSSYGGEDTPRGTSGSGGSGTAYSGGAGGGGSDNNSYGTWTYAGDGSSIGGAGGDGYGYRGSSSWATRVAAGGAGNPGGKGGQNGKGNIEDTTVENGTGGLLIINTNNLINNGSITANGAKGGTFGRGAGGSSGGGSINIFVNNNVDNNGTIEAKGGESANRGGAGGNGSVSIGKVIDGQYYDIDYLNAKNAIQLIENNSYPMYSLSNYQAGSRQIELQITDSNITELYYSVDNGTTWTKYENIITVSGNVDLKVKGKHTDNTETPIIEYPLMNFVGNEAFDSNKETSYTISKNTTSRLDLDSGLNSIILRINTVEEIASDATITFYNSTDEILKTYNVSAGLTNVKVPDNSTYMVINAGSSNLSIVEINNQNDYILSAKQNKPNITINTTGNATSKTIDIQYPTGDYTKEYSLDEGETWLEYTEPITITENMSILTRVVENGEVIYTSSYNVSNIQEEFYTLTGTMKKVEGEEIPLTEGNLVFFSERQDVLITTTGEFSVTNLKDETHEVYYMGNQDTSNMTKEDVVNNSICSATFNLNDTVINFNCNNGETYKITEITKEKQNKKEFLASDIIYKNEEYTECQDVQCALNELHERRK